MESTGRFTLVTLEPGSPAASLAEEVRTGLTAAQKYLPCRFFYDEEGSQLFEQICELPEYYVTRAEREILAAHADEIVASLPAGGGGSDPVDLVELGSGSAAKTRLLIDALLRRQPALRYVPVDISRSALEASARGLLAAYRGVRVDAVAAEYHDGLRYLANLDALAAGTAGVTRTTQTAAVAGSAPASRFKLLLWLGSNVGNLDRDEAAAFLRGVCAQMGPDDRLLIGIDRRKERAVLEAAYDDAQGVTARFNKNLLARINRDLGGHFDLDSFVHRARYHETAGRIAMELVSTRAHAVRIDALQMAVPFAAGEAIHTENSFKYSDEEIESLAARSGFAVERQWYDTERRFSDALLRPLPRA
jgi:uncharacterized SAM-dependent methyltransferase